MEKLITKFDVENIILRKKYEDKWPQGLVEINVYHDEVEIRVKGEEYKEKVSDLFKEWFGTNYYPEEEKIYLEFPGKEKKRWLTLGFEIEPESEPVKPERLKPDFASYSLYPEEPTLDLKGPDFHKIPEPPSTWAFYSYKGGVSRTLHLVSLVKALSEQEIPKKTLIVDADLEAPGLTWWAEKQIGRMEISFLDFLALVHYDSSTNYEEALTITAGFLKHRTITFETHKERIEHYFLPAFRDFNQLMRMSLRPEHVCWESGKEWIIPELLWKLGKKLDVHAVIVDLRAGLSEISSPFLFDPRVIPVCRYYTFQSVCGRYR